MTGRFEHFDARPGGSYRLVLTYADAQAARGKSAGDSDVVDARFVEIVPEEGVTAAVREQRRWRQARRLPFVHRERVSGTHGDSRFPNRSAIAVRRLCGYAVRSSSLGGPVMSSGAYRVC